MDEEIKKKWVGALRSGKFLQGKEKLKSEDGYFCCLGVLTHLCRKGEWTEAQGAEDFLENDVMDWARLETENPEIQVEDRKILISELNDNHDYDFETLADLIEEQL